MASTAMSALFKFSLCRSKDGEIFRIQTEDTKGKMHSKTFTQKSFCIGVSQIDSFILATSYCIGDRSLMAYSSAWRNFLNINAQTFK